MPSRVSPATLRTHISSGTLAPIYVILGEDEFEKSTLATEFVESVDPELRPFNVDRFHGGDIAIEQVLDAVRTLPIGTPTRIVIVVHAERLLEPKRSSAAAERGLEAFEGYLESPIRETALVLVAARLDGRARLTRLLKKQAIEVECTGLDGIDDPARWVRAALSEAGFTVAPGAVRWLVDRAGGEVGRLRGDVERVRLYASGRREVTLEDVQAVGGAPVVGDDWAVTEAITRGQAGEALAALALSLESGAAPFMILGQLAWFVRSRLAPERVPTVIESVFETDLALKNSPGDPRVLLERLVVDLCGGARRERRGEAARPR